MKHLTNRWPYMAHVLATIICAGMFCFTAQAGPDLQIKKKKMTINELSSTFKTAGLELYFDDTTVDGTSMLEMPMEYTSPDAILGKALKNTTYGFKSLSGKFMIFNKKNMKGKLPEKITGHILYSDGSPLYGAVIQILGTEKSALSDNHGKYTIRLPENACLMKVSFLGNEDAVLQIKPKEDQGIFAMSECKTALDEVVFVGYSKMQKRDVLGSISSLKADELSLNSGSGDILTAMKGKIAGLNVVANSGEPGAGAQVTLRGAASLSGSGEPLYIIDGVPIEVENDVSITGDATFSPLSNLNLNEVESIEVLKDAASAAIYGSKAANGVIIVTTKGGNLGKIKPHLTFSHTSSVLSPSRKLDVMNSDEFREAYIDARINFNGQYPTNDWVVNPTHPYYARSIDWQDLLFRTVYNTKNNLSLRGSSPDFSYSISFGYKDQKPVAIETSYKQYNMNGKFIYKITPWLRAGTNLYYTNTKYNRIISSAGDNLSALKAAVTTNPCMSPYDPFTGELLTWLGTSSTGGRNPIAIAKMTPFIYKTEWTMLNQWFEFKICKGLTFKINASLDTTASSQDYYRDKDIVSQLSDRKVDTNQHKEYTKKNFTNENVLNFSRRFNKHLVQAMVGESMQMYRLQENRMSGERYIDPNIIPIQNAGKQLQVLQLVEARNMLSFFARANYNYDGRYLISASIRSDGSSRFGPNKRFGYFPSASVGWRFSHEPFMKKARRVLTDGKIRFSYGVTGNQNIGNYAWRGIYRSNDERYDNNIAIKHSSLQNSDIGWETTTQYNLGLDLNLWNDRLIITVDLYDKLSKDLLFNFPLNTYTGFSSVARNYGSIENKGIELNINTINIQHTKFSWRTDFNIAWNKNRITALPGNEDFIMGNYSLGRVGEPAGVFFAHNALGVYAYTKDNIWYDEDGTVREIRQGSVNGEAFRGGDVIWEDLDNNGVIDDKDRKVIGSPHPIFFGGIGNTFNIGDFYINVYFDFSYGNKIMNELRRNRNRMVTTGNLGADALKRWRKEGDVTDFPRIIYADRMQNFRPSTMTMEDGSFLRLSNISFGYEFPSRLLSKARISKLRLSASINNLLTWSNYSGFDPEISSSSNPFMRGIDKGSFPKNRALNIGLDITF